MKNKEVSLENITDAQLEAELKRRQQLAHTREIERRKNAALVYMQNIDTLLQLCPKHDRTWCNDGAPSRDCFCNRCVLLNAKDDKYWISNLACDLSIRTLPDLDDE